MQFTSLFFRMRAVHWVAITLLSLNALLFIDNLYGIIIQWTLVLAVIVHDFDEKKWGVDSLRNL